ncbi:MAG: transcriptional regulator [Candidatus Bathyarchaeia archaeon]
MKPPCEVSTKYMLPAVRAVVARRLIEEYGYTQSSVAKILGTTQAAVSHYINVKRGGRFIEKLLSIDEARKVIDGIVDSIVSGSVFKENYICELCKIMRPHLE